MWLVILVLVGVIGWMLYGAGRRSAARDMVRAIDKAELDAAAQASITAVTTKVDDYNSAMSAAWEELVEGAAQKVLLEATGGEPTNGRVALLEDADLRAGLEAAMAKMGPARAKVPPGFEARAFSLAKETRDSARAARQQLRAKHEADELALYAVYGLASVALREATKLAPGRKREAGLSDLEVIAGLDAALKEDAQRPEPERLYSAALRGEGLRTALKMRDDERSK